jgi:hypothetical protein
VTGTSDRSAAIDVAAIIDHTLLKPEATPADVAALIAEAAELGTYSVCVSPSMLPISVPDGLKVAAVCGFPSGKHTSSIKAAEAAGAVADGADEIDMVIDVGAAKAGAFDAVQADIAAVRAAAPAPTVLKVIIESAALTDDEIVAMMDAETWMTASEAKERGFADQIEAPVKLQASVRTEELLARFEHTPEALLKALEAPPAEPPQAAAPAAPVATTPPPDPGALAQHAFAACRTAGLPQLAEAVVVSSALASAEAIDAVVARAKDIAGLCTAAHLPELAAQFVADGLNAEQVRARLYDRVMASSTPGLSNRQPVAGQETTERKTGPHGPSIYSARRKKSASAFA